MRSLDLRQARKIIGAHFPHLEEHFEIELAYELTGADMAASLAGFWGGHGDAKALEALARSLMKSRGHLMRLSDQVRVEFDHGAKVERKDPRGGLYSLGISPEQMLDALLKGVSAAQQSDEVGAKTKARVRAGAVVDGCRSIWERATGTPPPTYVSADSRRKSRGAFHDFAQEVLRAFGETVGVESAHRAWREHVSSSAE